MYTVTNKVIKKALREDPIYQEIIAKDKSIENVEVFLHAYSPQYAEAYPINAKWKKHTFLLNQKGRLNAQSSEYFNEWLKDFPNGNEADFKEQVTKAYKNV